MITIIFQAESTQDGQGNVIPGAEQKQEFAGRFELNTKGAFIIGDNGKRIEHTGVFYAPLNIGSVPLGATAKVLKHDGGAFEAVVQQFSRGQLNARIWL